MDLFLCTQVRDELSECWSLKETHSNPRGSWIQGAGNQEIGPPFQALSLNSSEAGGSWWPASRPAITLPGLHVCQGPLLQAPTAPAPS